MLMLAWAPWVVVVLIAWSLLGLMLVALRIVATVRLLGVALMLLRISSTAIRRGVVVLVLGFGDGCDKGAGQGGLEHNCSKLNFYFYTNKIKLTI